MTSWSGKIGIVGGSDASAPGLLGRGGLRPNSTGCAQQADDRYDAGESVRPHSAQPCDRVPISIRYVFFFAGTGMPAIFTFTMCSDVLCGEIERLPIVAAEGDIGRRGLAVHDAAELLARLVHDVEPARAAGIDVAGRVHLHAVGHAGLGAAQIGEQRGSSASPACRSAEDRRPARGGVANR